MLDGTRSEGDHWSPLREEYVERDTRASEVKERFDLEKSTDGGWYEESICAGL